MRHKLILNACLILSLAFTGCQQLQQHPGIGSNGWTKTFGKDAKQFRDNSNPIESFGIDQRAREIERNLGVGS